MAEEQLNQAMEEHHIELPLIKRLLQPQNLKKIIIGFASLIILLIIGITTYSVITSTRPDDAPNWLKDYGRIKFTSYKQDSYGTFYCSIELYLAYLSSSVRKSLHANKHEIIDTIRRVISKENYYSIDTELKRTSNLTPKLIKAINLTLRSSDGKGVVDISYPTFLIVPNREPSYIRSTYYNLGRFTIPIRNKEYNVEMHLIFDASSVLFNSLLSQNTDKMKKIVKNHIIKNQKAYSEFLNFDSSKKKIKVLVEKKLEQYFRQLEEEIKANNSLYEETKQLPGIYFSLFKEIKSKK